jgi:hypothetical protein
MRLKGYVHEFWDVARFFGKSSDNSILNTRRNVAISTVKSRCGSAVRRLYDAAMSIWPIVQSLLRPAFYGLLNSQFLSLKPVQ